MFYLVYDNVTHRVYGFFYNEKMAEAGSKNLKRQTLRQPLWFFLTT